MKKILLIILFLFTSLQADVKWSDIFDAYDVAKKENKTVMIMLSQKGCPGCEYMKNVVFGNDNVSKALSEGFISVHIDVHEDFIPEELKYFATPTFYFLDADEHILKRINGGENAKDFLDTLEKVKFKK